MDIKIILILCFYSTFNLINSLPQDDVFSKRVVRAAAEVEDLNDKNYYKEYEGDDKGDVGYHRKKSEKHNRGYELFDSFHKKHGDDYSFDNSDKGKTHNGKGTSENSGAKYSESRSYEDKPKKKAIYTEGYEVTEDHVGDGDESHSSYRTGNLSGGDGGNSDEVEEYEESNHKATSYLHTSPNSDHSYHHNDEGDDDDDDDY